MNHVSMDIQPETAGLIAPQDFMNAGLEPLAEFAEQTRRLEATLRALKQVAGEAASHSLTKLVQELNAFEPAVTILGQVKSGKTTLVNALAGWSDLLPSDVNPWTSVVTSLHLTPGPHRREIGARFQLMKEEEWDRLLSRGGRLGELARRADAEGELDKIREQIELMREKSRRRLGKKFEFLLGQEHEYGYFDRNLLERYICLGDDFLSEPDAHVGGTKQGWFADITRSADLYLHCPSIPFQMCLRDTPGVNDTFLMREQVTIGAVRDSRVCVVVLSAHQALTSTDMGLIRLISNLKSRDVIIFVNRIDELQDPGTQVAEIERSIRQTLERHQGPVDAAIIFGSAYWANKVLAEEVDDISLPSANALVNWAEAALPDADLERQPAEMVWELSGIPGLNRAIAERTVATLGIPHLRKIASAAVTIAGSLQAANTVRVTGQAGPTLDPATLTRELDALTRAHVEALARDLASATSEYQSRAERAHASFLERATHSLVRHLEDYGDGIIWEYDANGLRILLKSSYSVYTARASAIAKTHYKAAVEDIAELLFRAFGEAVEGIELALPEPPDAPAPVALAQTIILDFNDGWWRSWWRRTRGYKAFSQQFYQMISAETADFIAQFKTVPPRDLTAQVQAVLARFLEQGREIAAEIGAGQVGEDRLQGPMLGNEAKQRSLAIETLLCDLREQVKETQVEGMTS